MKRVLSIALRAAIGVGAVAAGVFVFAGLIATKPEPQSREPEDRGLLVQVQEAEPGDHRVVVDAQGLVIPAEQVTVQAEVTGRVVWLHPSLIAGGRVDRGEVLVKIDPRDYRLQASQAAAEIERARVELELERGRKQVAEREWKILGPDGADESARARALREPQIRAAENALEAAKSGLARAKLMVQKTIVRAPFNALVISEQVARGQLVGPQAPLATLVQTDSFYVRATVPTDELGAILIPGINAEPGEGSEAIVRHDTGSGRIEARGRIIRLLGDLDPAGQMARVVIEIDDPMPREPGTGRKPLLLGSHVVAEIDAGILEDVVEIPRSALRDGREVFVKQGDLLEVVPVEIAWRTDQSVFVKRGLAEGDQVVLGTLTAPVPGMKLRAENAAAGDELARGR